MNLTKMKINKRTRKSYVEKASNLESFTLVLISFYLSVCLSVYVSYIANSRAPSFLLDSLSKYVS